MLELEPGFLLHSYVANRMPMRDSSFRIRFARDLRAAGIPA